MRYIILFITLTIASFNVLAWTVIGPPPPATHIAP